MTMPDWLRADAGAGRMVIPDGLTVWLTVLASAIMALLAVFALAAALAAHRTAAMWEDGLARKATIRIAAAAEAREAQADRTLRVLQSTPGIASARRIAPIEAQALLEPWLGPDLPLDVLPVPVLIEVTTVRTGFDTEGLRARLAGEAPDAVLDDHSRWRAPLVAAAARIRTLGLLCVCLVTAAAGAIVALAAQAALAVNADVIATLRLMGARDSYIVRAFVKRLTLRAAAGAAAGTAVGVLTLLQVPETAPAETFLAGPGFDGLGWALPILIPLFAAAIAFLATRLAALRRLKDSP